MNTLRVQQKNQMRFVSHFWTSSYLLRVSGMHYRKATRFLSKIVKGALTDWVGSFTWGSPIVALAPPRCVSFKRRNDAVISVTIGARDAMISFRKIYEKTYGKPR